MYLIVGGSAAGLSAAQTIRKFDEKGEVTVVSEEDPYTRVYLAEYLGGEASIEKLSIKSENFFLRNRINFLRGTVEKIHDGEVLVRTAEGKETTLSYEKLLIAAGSKPFVPPIKGVDLEGVFTFWTIKDVRKILEFVNRHGCKRAAVIGAGPIGLEVAQTFREMGIDVAVFELMDRILPGVADPEVAEVVEREYKSMGVEVYTGERVEEIYGHQEEDRVRGISTSNWGDFPADIVILSTGVRPRTDLAHSFVDVNVGVVVNERMETSREDVFAAGDVAEAPDVFGERRVVGSWISAVQQGKVAGMNMVGKEVEHSGSIRVSTIKKVRTPMLSIGKAEGEREIFRGRNFVRVAYFDENRLVGFQSAGNFFDVRMSGAIQVAITRGVSIKDRREFLKRPQRFLDKRITFYAP